MRSPSSRLPGSRVATVEAKDAFAKSVGPTTLQGVPILFGYNVRPDMPEAVVYKMIKAFYDKREELVKIEAGFTPMAKDFIGMQVQGINANPTSPRACGPRQVPEGAQGLGREVEGRAQHLTA